MYWIWVENLSMAFSTPELQAPVIATQLHIHHLIRELYLVYLNSLLDLLDGQLDVRHATFVKLTTSLTVLFLKTSIAFFNGLMTSSSFGDFLTSEAFCVTESVFQPAVTSSRRELICHPFISPTRALNTISTLTTRIGFSDASFSIARTIKPLPIGTHFSTCLPLALLFLSWVLGSRPWLFFFLRVLTPWVFHRRFW